MIKEELKKRIEEEKEKLRKLEEKWEKRKKSPIYQKYLEHLAEEASRKFCENKPCFICGFKGLGNLGIECYAYGTQFLCLCGNCFDAQPKANPEDLTDIDASEWVQILEKQGKELYILYEPNGQPQGRLIVKKKGEPFD